MRMWGPIRRVFDSMPRGDAVPQGLTEQAVIPGIPGARLWADRELSAFVELVVDDNRRVKAGASTITLSVPPMGGVVLLKR